MNCYTLSGRSNRRSLLAATCKWDSAQTGKPARYKLICRRALALPSNERMSFGYRGFCITSSANEVAPHGTARRFQAGHQALLAGSLYVCWSVVSEKVFDTQTHALMNTREDARRSVRRYWCGQPGHPWVTA